MVRPFYMHYFKKLSLSEICTIKTKYSIYFNAIHIYIYISGFTPELLVPVPYQFVIFAMSFLFLLSVENY